MSRNLYFYCQLKNRKNKNKWMNCWEDSAMVILVVNIKSCMHGRESLHVFGSGQMGGSWLAGLQIWEDLCTHLRFHPFSLCSEALTLSWTMSKLLLGVEHWGSSLIGTALIISGLFLVTWGQTEERRLKALSVDLSYPKPWEHPPDGYSAPWRHPFLGTVNLLYNFMS
jgi:hypothetical protein